jgi:uncharacterized membrane protein
MKHIIKRKDNTSIFCQKINISHHFSKQKVRYLELIMACIFMTLGIWILLLTH